MPSPRALLSTARDRSPALDHLLRAFGRYQADAGDRQAAAVTFFGFLSFFPILALATSVLSYALGEDAVSTVVDQVNAYAPGLADQLQLREILTDNTTAGAAGAIGLLGLLYSGLGWVDALREAVRVVWHHNVRAGNVVVKKAKDVLILAGLGATILLSVAVSAATGAFSSFALEQVGLDTSPAALVVTRVVGIALGLLTSFAIFIFLFWRLPKVQSPFGKVAQGALLAAVLFELLKRVGAFYIDRTTQNPIYGSFAVIVGLLVWINIVSRMLLICAAWTVTAPYDSDVEPSGTSSVSAAARAGIPLEYADQDPDDPPTLREDGAPTPLAAAVQGSTPPQDVPEGRGADARASPARSDSARSDSARSSPDRPDPDRSGPSAMTRPVPRPPTTATGRPAPRNRFQLVVRQATQFAVGASATVVVVVALSVLNAVRKRVRG